MKKILGLFVLLLFCFSCAKENNLIPNIPVNFSSPLTDPRLSRLSAVGGAVMVSGGIAGIII